MKFLQFTQTAEKWRDNIYTDIYSALLNQLIFSIIYLSYLILYY